MMRHTGTTGILSARMLTRIAARATTITPKGVDTVYYPHKSKYRILLSVSELLLGLLRIRALEILHYNILLLILILCHLKILQKYC